MLCPLKTYLLSNLSCTFYKGHFFFNKKSFVPEIFFFKTESVVLGQDRKSHLARDLEFRDRKSRGSNKVAHPKMTFYIKSKNVGKNSGLGPSFYRHRKLFAIESVVKTNIPLTYSLCSPSILLA